MHYASFVLLRPREISDVGCLVINCATNSIARSLTAFFHFYAAVSFDGLATGAVENGIAIKASKLQDCKLPSGPGPDALGRNWRY